MHPRILTALYCSLMMGLIYLPSTTSAFSNDSTYALNQFIDQFVDFGMFDGTVLVDQGGEIIYEHSFGRASYEFDQAHNGKTRFRIASLSKALTDAAIARLVQEDKLSLDDSIDAFVPDFPRSAEISIRQLLNHTSGIPHTNDQPWGNETDSLAINKIILQLAALPLDFDPGSDRNYSNGGYAVLAKVVEIVADQPFAAAMSSILFEPLAMQDSGHVVDGRQIIDNMATGYEPGYFPGERRHARFYAVENRPGGGSAYSTARDLHRLADAVFRKGFVSDELLESVLGADDSGFLSQGRSPGFVAKLLYQPETDIIVISLANNYAVPADWAITIANLASGSEMSSGWPDLVQTGSTVSSTDPRQGRFVNSFGGTTIKISRSERGALILQDKQNQSATALVPLRDGAFLQPLYYQLCQQRLETRTITCEMLSGNPRYKSTLTPIDE